MRWTYFRYLGEISLLFAIYFVTARFGLAIDAVSRFATLVWIPSGVSLAALLIFGYRFWPGIILGAFLVNLLNGASIFIALGISIGNTLEAVIGTYLLKRLGFSNTLRHLKDVLLLISLAAFLSTMVSASIGVLNLFLGGVISYTSIVPTWQAWWIGDMMSIILITPLLLKWKKGFKRTVPKQIFEISMLVVVTILVGVIIFRGLFVIDSKGSPITYLVFIPIIWAALRFGQLAGVTVTFFLSCLAIVATIQGIGPFATGKLSERLLLLQSFMGVTAITSMIVAAVDSERRSLERRKDEFISLASHELKTPLTSLKAYTQVLYKYFSKSTDKKTALYLKKMDTQIDKLTVLINDLLDISKIQAEKLEFHKEDFALEKLIKDTVENVQTTIESHTIIIKNADKKHTTVYADRERVGQVLINLCTNAIKYSPSAKKIIIKTQADKTYMIVSVQDFGIGIAKDHHKKIFHRYYRAQDAGTDTFPGLGIGLYISHQIIKRNDGKMWVESEKGEGSTFYFSLPLYKH